MDSSTPILWAGPFQIEGRPGKIFFYKNRVINIPVVNANSVDPNQTPSSAASDLDLRCLLVPRLCDARLKWVKLNEFSMHQCLHFSKKPAMSSRQSAKSNSG